MIEQDVAQPISSTNTGNANLQAVGILLLSVVLAAIGQLMLKTAVNSMGKLEVAPETILRLVSNPVLILALAIYGASAVVWLLALMRADLSFAYPFLSLTYITVLFGGAIFFHEKITPLRIAGFLIVMGGLLIIARAEKPTGKSTNG